MKIMKLIKLIGQKKINKGNHCLLKIITNYNSTCILISTNKNMKFLLKQDNEFYSKIIINKVEESLIY